jgi:hypothetical protein
MIGVGPLDKLPPVSTVKAVFPHQTGYSLPADPFAIYIAKFTAYPRASIPIIMFGNYFPDKAYKFDIGFTAPLEHPFPYPLVIGAAAYPKKSGHLPNGILALVCFHEPVRH